MARLVDKTVDTVLTASAEQSLPVRFDDARAIVLAAFALCEQAGIPRDTTLAALMTELMPRLIAAYGPDGVAAVLANLSTAITDGMWRPPPWQ